MRVSLPLTAARGQIHTVLAVFCAVAALVVVAAAAAPPSAHASFTVPKCGGSAIQGEGSSFQKVAQQQYWIPTVFYSSFGCGSGAASSSPVTYVSDGSGCGIASIGGGGSTGKCSDFESSAAVGGYRDPNTRFGSSDAPLTPTQQTAADAVGSEHPGLIHTLPVADGAVTIIVHFPEGCELEDPGTGTAASGAGTVNENTTTGGVNDPTGHGTGDTAANHDLRVHISAATIEKIWDGTPTTWGEVVKNHMTGAPTSPLEAEEGFTKCNEVPVRRIVRFDGSGTTYNFKAYLSLLPGVTPSEVWSKSPVVGDNTNWPLTTSSTGVPKAVPKTEEVAKKELVNVCNLTVSGASRICTGFENGNGAMANAVAATDGSIGYPDLATARQKGFDIVPTKSGTPDHTYWISLQTIDPSKVNAVGTNYVEPTASPQSHIQGGGSPNGSNCTNADYRGVPSAASSPNNDPTLGNWSAAIATGSTDTTTYPVCALTYVFAFDDDSTVFSKTLPEQMKARTVKDYLEAMVSSVGQAGLLSADYGALRSDIVGIAQNGVNAIDWEKSAGSGGPKEEVKKAPPVEVKTGGGTTVVTPPSNAFSIAGAKVKGKAIVLSLVLPNAGSVQVKATGGGVTVSSVTSTVSGGNGSVILAISKAALKKLAKVKSHKLSVKITVTFTPTGGTAASKVKTLTLTQVALTPKKKATKGKKK